MITPFSLALSALRGNPPEQRLPRVLVWLPLEQDQPTVAGGVGRVGFSGVAACAQAVEDEVRQRVEEKVEQGKQRAKEEVEKGKQRLEREGRKAKKKIEQEVQKARKQAEEKAGTRR
jgi:hypothetical protein